MKFINYVNIKTGKLNANASDENGIYPFYTCADVPLKINMALDNCECLLLVGNGANTGKVFYNNGPFNAYQRTYIIKSTQIFNHKYLFWFLKSKTKFLLASSIGSATNYIKLGDIENLNISEKTEEEQDNIVFELNSYQKLLELKNNELLMLDNLIKSRFIEMFGDVFKGESKYPLIKISNVVESKIERASKDFKQEDEIQYVDISSIDNKKNIIIGYTRYIKKDAPSRAQQHVKLGDIVVSTVRPNLNNVARIPNDYNNIVASSGFCVLRAINIDSDYLFGLVSMQSFADYLASLTTGANYPAVSDKDILNFEIPNAPIDKQKEFSSFIKQIDKSKFISYSRYFLCEILTLFSSTIAYSRVVSIF